MVVVLVPQAIEARSMGQEKSNHVHALTLCFRDSTKERQYQRDTDASFGSSLACSLVITLVDFFVPNIPTFRRLIFAKTSCFVSSSYPTVSVRVSKCKNEKFYCFIQNSRIFRNFAVD